MDDSMIWICIFLGVIGIIIIFAIIYIMQNTKEMNETLKAINYKLDSSGGSFNGQGSVSKSLRPKDDSWVCNCGARNYGSKTCTKCGANKNDR